MPGFGGAGPPPPPPLPGGVPNPDAVPARPPLAISKDRGALLGEITKGTRLKKAVTNDRSAPIIDKEPSSSAGKAITAPLAGPGLAPPVPGTAPNRARSNSDSGHGSGSADGGSIPAAPQLGGIFAGVGIPKLKKTGGGIDTGAERDSSYLSDPETSRKSTLQPPASTAPKPPGAPKINSLRPSLPYTESSPPQPTNPLVANLRKAPPRPAQRPSLDVPSRTQSSADTTPPRNTAASKPPPPPIASRKPSTAAPPPPTKPPTPPSAPPPPPSSAPRSPPVLPQQPAPQPPANAPPRHPPARSTPPPPPPPPTTTIPAANDTLAQSVAMQAARNAFGSGSSTPVASPAAPPPPPPPLQPTPASLTLKHSVSSALAGPPSVPPPPPSRPPSQSPAKPTLDPSLYTLSNGNSTHRNSSPLRHQSSGQGTGRISIQDSRWRFQDDGQLPKPREFIGFPKKYRAGRGSSVPLDISQFE
ncbi:MAG: hypothetical protein Q9191_000420 [Dirinaria sp. TL-2023a]